MIRELKVNQEFYYWNNGIRILSYSSKEIKVFINDENFLHNDVGAAWYHPKIGGEWWWNGFLIE